MSYWRRTLIVGVDPTKGETFQDALDKLNRHAHALTPHAVKHYRWSVTIVKGQSRYWVEARPTTPKEGVDFPM